MRLTGLEPALREKPDPKSGASTNSATGASKAFCGLLAFFAGAKVLLFRETTKLFPPFLYNLHHFFMKKTKTTQTTYHPKDVHVV